MIIAHNRENTAIRRGSGHVRMTERIARAINTGAFAVPDGKDAVIFPLAAHLGLLGAPTCGCRDFLVDARLKQNIARREMLGSSKNLSVDSAKRGAAIARNKPRSVQSGAPVALVLGQKKADNRLRARDEDTRLVEVIFVIKADGRGGIIHLNFHPQGRTTSEGSSTV